MMVSIMIANEPPPSPRFLTIEQVSLELATSKSQIYALLRSGDLKGIQIGGRGQWRIERVKLEEYLSQESACDGLISGDGGGARWTTSRRSSSSWWCWVGAATRCAPISWASSTSAG